MAQAYDNSDLIGVNNGAGTRSKAFTCAAGAYLMGISGPNVTGVTYNGVAMTAASYDPDFPSGTQCPTIKLWFLANPASGSNTAQGTFGDSDFLALVSYTGVNLDVQPADFAVSDSANFSNTTWPGEITTTEDGQIVVMFIISENPSGNRTWSAGAGTLRNSQATGINQLAYGIIDSGTPVATSGTSTTLRGNLSTGTALITAYTICLKNPTTINVNDSVAISENVNMEKILNLSVSEAISITESINTEYVLTIVVGEDISITESRTIDNGTLADIVVFEAISVTDYVHGDYYPSLLSGAQEMNSIEDKFPLGMDDETIL